MSNRNKECINLRDRKAFSCCSLNAAKIMTLSLIAVTIVVFTSCELETIDSSEVDLGTGYFPVKEGIVRTYEVELISFLSNNVDTVNYELKHEIGSAYEEGGLMKNLVNIYTRDSEDESWSRDSLWSIYANNNEVVENRNNVQLTYLTFPLEEGTSWDINSYNTREEDVFIYDEQGSLDLGSVIYDDVITCRFAIVDNLIDKNIRTWKFARGVGLVQRSEEVSTQQIGEAKVGYQLEVKLISYEE